MRRSRPASRNRPSSPAAPLSTATGAPATSHTGTHWARAASDGSTKFAGAVNRRRARQNAAGSAANSPASLRRSRAAIAARSIRSSRRSPRACCILRAAGGTAPTCTRRVTRSGGGSLVQDEEKHNGNRPRTWRCAARYGIPLPQAWCASGSVYCRGTRIKQRIE